MKVCRQQLIANRPTEMKSYQTIRDTIELQRAIVLDGFDPDDPYFAHLFTEDK